MERRSNQWYVAALARKDDYVDALTDASLSLASAKSALVLAEEALDFARAEYNDSIEVTEVFDGNAIWVDENERALASPVTGRAAHLDPVYSNDDPESLWMFVGAIPYFGRTWFGRDEPKWTHAQALENAKKWITQTF